MSLVRDLYDDKKFIEEEIGYFGQFFYIFHMI